MFRTFVLVIVAAAAITPATAYADNIDFGTNQDACQAAAHQAAAGGNASAFCFQTGPGHYSLSYSPSQGGSYSAVPAYAPPTPRPPGNDYVAVAASPSHPDSGWTGAAPTQQQADQIAMSGCAGACVIVARSHLGCAAVGVDVDGNLVGGWGPTGDAASGAVLTNRPGARVLGGQCANPSAN